MPINAYKCLKNAYKCLQMLENAYKRDYKRLQMPTNTNMCLQTATCAYKCLKNASKMPPKSHNALGWCLGNLPRKNKIQAYPITTLIYEFLG